MQIKKNFLIIIVVISAEGCKEPLSKLFKPTQTPHDAYADNLKNDSLGKAWVTVSKNSLQNPLPVNLPYRQKGHFLNDKLRAITLKFETRRGERITLEIKNKDNHNSLIFADIFKQDAASFTHVVAADTGTGILQFNIEESGNLFLRLQPEIKNIENYELQITSGPSLTFPVAGNRSIWSVWGDVRDGGARSHEGIDIGAPRNTPAVAAAEGIISRVQESGIGGKTVSLRVKGRNLSLYYAHLDSQLVQQGQKVNAGDTIGWVGNTDNAITPPPHLHFGIYSFGGAVDPFPFVNKNVKPAPKLTAAALPKKLALIKAFPVNENTELPAKTILFPLAISTEGYIAETTEGAMIKVAEREVKKE